MRFSEVPSANGLPSIPVQTVEIVSPRPAPVLMISTSPRSRPVIVAATGTTTGSESRQAGSGRRRRSMSVVALKVVGGLPQPIALLLVILGGAAAGAFWGGLAGVLRAYRGTNEVISTLLLNFIGIGLVSLSVHETSLLRQPITSADTLPTTLPVPESTHLPLIMGVTSPANLGIVLAGAVLIAAWVALRHGMLGMRLRAVGLGPGAALRGGLATGRTQILAMALSGAPAGVAGALLVLAVPFVLQDGFSSGYGFDGLVVGLLARGSIVGVLAGAALFGCLRSGGVAMQIGLSIPAETVLIVQALIVIAVAGTAVLTRGNRSRSELI